MIIKIIGFRKSEFDYNGNHFTGRKIYFLNDDLINGQGCTTGTMFLNDSKFGTADLAVNDKFNVYYNRFGKVEVLEKI